MQQQKANGTTSKTLFGGAIWFEGFRLNWGGTWNYGNDIALLKVYSSSSSQRFAPDPNPLAAYARIWLGSTTATNCGACATPYNSRQTIYGYGMTFQADDSLWALHWGWVKAVSNYWNYWYSQPYDSDNNSLGQGDSGGSTGNLHGLYGWGIAGINSVTECDSIDSAGVCQKSTRFGSWYARPKYHYAWIMNTVGTCTVYNLGDGYALQCW